MATTTATSTTTTTTTTTIPLSWETRAADKASRVLRNVPAKFIHPELTHSTTDTSSVQDVPQQYLSRQELAITALTAEAIVAAVASREYTAVQVLDAFTHRASIAHLLLNCCLDFMYPTAHARAVELDEYLSREGKTVGPMHGLPISVKDQCRVKGTETTCGFVAFLGKEDEESCLLVQELEQAGAVVFTKTNLSVGCMWGETVNNIIGRTSNPFNRSFSCGGSSGGEGALIGFHGSPMGVGSDLGGSIRSPSAYQGLWGLRPSVGRIPYYHILNSMEGQETIASVVGPMTHSPKGLELFTKTVVDSQPWLIDPKCHPIPWRSEQAEEVRGRKLRVGVMHWDGVILPQPPVRRAMKEVEAKLKAAGHEIVPWRIDQAEAVKIIMRVFSADSNGDIDRTTALSGEPGLAMVGRSEKPPLTLLESWALAMEQLEFQAAVLKQWRETADAAGRPIDVYLAPVNPSVCPKHGDYGRVRYLAYTSTVNMLDFTACTIPVTFVDETLDGKDAESGDRDAKGEEIPSPTCELDENIRKNFDPAVYKGMPVTVQIVGRRLEEEKVLAIAQEMEKLLSS